MNVCAVCRFVNEAGRTTCWSCGSPLVAETPEPEDLERAERERAERERAEDERQERERAERERERRVSKAPEQPIEAALDEFQPNRGEETRGAPQDEPQAAKQRKAPELNLLAKFSLLIVVVLGAGLVVGGIAWRGYLQSEARNQVLDQAKLMIQTAIATRTYTEKQIQPLVGVRRESDFHPQWVPFYAASQIFQYLKVEYPDYSYKEAALNAMNPRDRAVPWEADVINYFRNNPGQLQISGERDTVTGRSLYFAHPIVAEAGCLACHSSVAAAPPKMVSLYGPANGFGWKLNEVIGAQIVSVPTAVTYRIADGAFRGLLGSLFAFALLTLVAVGAAITLLVSRPVRRATAAIDDVGSAGLEAPELPARTKDEVGRLEDAFNRMRRRLQQRRAGR